MAGAVKQVSMLVAGGREMFLGPIGWTVLDAVRDGAEDARSSIATVIHGAAPGADESAGRWASSRGIVVDEHPASWRRPDGSVDRSAGVRRSAEMVAMRPDIAVIFPGGDGTDRTAEMLAKAGRTRTLDLRRMAAVRVMSHHDVRRQVERRWASWSSYLDRHPGTGIGVAQVGAFQGDRIPDHAIWVGAGGGLGRSRLAMPCVDRVTMSAEKALCAVRRMWKAEPAMRELVASGDVYAGLLVCSCGSRACLAPVLGTVLTHMLCRRSIEKANHRLPDDDESASSLVEWSRLSMVAAAGAWSCA